MQYTFLIYFSGETYGVPATDQSYTLAGDVGLLTRNIKIIGEDYPDWYTESFGARVLVGSIWTNDDTEYRGVLNSFSNLDLYVKKDDKMMILFLTVNSELHINLTLLLTPLSVRPFLIRIT